MVNYKFLLISIVFLVVFSLNVSAFAVTSYYWENNPLIIEPGKTIDIKAFGLQNMVGGEDITVKASPGAGQEIAKIIDSSLVYEVPFGRKDIYINMKISIPENIPLGTEYDVGVSFSRLASEEGKTIQLTTGIDSNIKVIVDRIKEEKPVEETRGVTVSDNFLFSGLALLIVIIAVLIYYYGFVKRHKIVKRKR